jgi:N-acyl-D-amino-acid deacylase
MNIMRVGSLAGWLLLIVGSLGAAPYDLVLRHGRVVDGTGNPAYFADVGICEGRIAAVGRVSGEARTELDVSGLIIAPGFIDVHTHADDIVGQPLAENFVRMGVTTVVAGNCGSSTLEVARFFRRIEATNVSINVATLIGHGSVREKAMGGSFNRPPTDGEMRAMKAMVEQGMSAGAEGLSTGLIYLPGEFAKTEEIIELAKVVAAFDGIYTSHMRNESREILGALAEVFRIAREAHLRAEVSHIKLGGKSAWGQAGQVLAAIEEARASGLDITQDQYLYTASSTGLSQLVPEKYREGGKFRERLAEASTKAAMIADMKERLSKRGQSDYAYAVIAQYKKDHSLDGLNLAEAARQKRGSDSLDDQIELILEIQANGGASGIFHGMSEEDLRVFAQHPNTMFACDSGLRTLGEGVPHPRGYGNCARVLARYVRETKLLRLEDAVRRMTSLPASTFRFEDRGLVRTGGWADLVVFDPAKVQDNATFKDPHHYATGFACVLVNGVLVVKDDVHTGARPGQALRHPAPGH